MTDVKNAGADRDAHPIRKVFLMSIFAMFTVLYSVFSGSAAPYSYLTDIPEWTIFDPAPGTGGSASRYDKNDCDRMFGSANVEKVTLVNINGGNADFGDDPHLFGAPSGNAVLCWSIDGRVAVKGRLYADSLSDAEVAYVRIRFRRTNGRWTRSTRRSVATQGGAIVISKAVEKVSPRGNFNRVRIRLSYVLNDTGIAGATETKGVRKNYDR